MVQMLAKKAPHRRHALYPCHVAEGLEDCVVCGLVWCGREGLCGVGVG